MRKSTPCFFELDGVGRVVGDALGDGRRSSTSSSKPEGALGSARTLPVTMREDSRVRFLRVSKTASGTAALGTMPWMVPVPSRKVGKSSLPEAAEVVEPAAEGDGLAFVGGRGWRWW